MTEDKEKSLRADREMVHLSDRRYRLNPHEIDPVMDSVKHRLGELTQDKTDLQLAQDLFMVLYRFENYKVGRPSYPEPITWGLIEAWLDTYDKMDHFNEEEPE